MTAHWSPMRLPPVPTIQRFGSRSSAIPLFKRFGDWFATGQVVAWGPNGNANRLELFMDAKDLPVSRDEHISGVDRVGVHQEPVRVARRLGSRTLLVPTLHLELEVHDLLVTEPITTVEAGFTEDHEALDSLEHTFGEQRTKTMEVVAIRDVEVDVSAHREVHFATACETEEHFSVGPPCLIGSPEIDDHDRVER